MPAILTDPVELRRQGFEALVKALGWVNAVRFLQQYEVSRLDYTTETQGISPRLGRGNRSTKIAGTEDRRVARRSAPHPGPCAAKGRTAAQPTISRITWPCTSVRRRLVPLCR
jgi:hypothetical protein